MAVFAFKVVNAWEEIPVKATAKVIFLDAKLVCLNNAPLDGDTGHLGHLAQTLAKKDSKQECENARLVLTNC